MIGHWMIGHWKISHWIRRLDIRCRKIGHWGLVIGGHSIVARRDTGFWILDTE
jgi:hypothetical protein